MKSKALTILQFLVGWPLSILALFFIYRLASTHLTQLELNFATINYPMLFLSVLCFLTYYAFKSYIWYVILKIRGHRVPLITSVFLWTSSEINRYIPGNIWAFLSRGMNFNKLKIDHKTIAHALIYETIIVLLGASIVSLFSLSFVVTNFLNLVPGINVLVILGLLGFVGSLFFVIFASAIHKRIPVGKKILSTLQKYTPHDTFYLLILSTVTFLFFGFGYVFAILSIAPFDVQLVFSFVGFSVLALIIGFISFITPTGLGVREGILTAGLAKVTTLGLAGLSALFTRIVLIASEVIFLGIALLLYKTPQHLLLKPLNLLSNHKHVSVLTFCVVLYVTFISITSFLRYDNYYTGRFDLGNMIQTVWNSSKGNIFEMSHPEGTVTISRLAYHADVILVGFVPFYYIWQSANMLLFFQALVVGIGAYAIYLISRIVLSNKHLSLIFSISYLLNPSVMWANLYDFHAVVLATTFLLFAILFVLKKKYLLFVVFAVLSGITKEQVWFITGLIGIWIMIPTIISLFHKSKKHQLIPFWYGLGISIVSFTLFYFLIWHAIPYARGGEHFALAFYEDFGSSPTDIAKSILTSPTQVAQTIFEKSRLTYLKQLFLPLGFLPLLWPFPLIFAGPDLAINILSNNKNLHQIYYQYTATITPFLFLSSIYAARFAKRLIPSMSLGLFGLFVFSVTIYSAYLYGPLPGSKRANIAMFNAPQKNRLQIREALNTIPQNASVAASNNVASHLSERRDIFVIPYGIEQVDYIVILRPSEDEQFLIDQLKNNPNFILMDEIDDFVVFKRTTFYSKYY